MTKIENRPVWRKYFPYLAKWLSKRAAYLTAASSQQDAH
jgi:hypothetical protein